MERWRLEPAAALLLAALAVVWSWWAAKDGAFFGTVLLPGTMLLCATTVVLAWAAPWRASLRPSRPATIALAALAALGVWAALSAIWSPAPDVAIETGQRILTYALAFGLGIWLSALLGSRLHLALVPLAVAGAFAGIVAVVGMLTGDHVRHYLELDGTLEFPLGYRNANAAFFAIALWPALGLASRRAGAWPVRAAALATATLCLDLAMLSQSRGSLPAGAVALCVYLLFATDRARRLAWLALAALPALLILPSLVDLYHAGSGDAPLSSALDELRAAGRAVALTSPAVAGDRHGGGAGGQTRPGLRSGGSRSPTGPPWWGWWRRCSPARSPSSSSPAIRSTGSTSAFRSSSSGHNADLRGQSSRFVTLNAATQRPGIWRVALLDARHHPLLGDGGGGFRYTYLTRAAP